MKRSLVAFAPVLCFVLAAAVPAAACSGPDPSSVVLDDADIWHITGGDLLTVLANPFPDGAVVGAWIAVRTQIDQPLEYFQIISNEYFSQNDTSVFTVAEDLESEGGRDWWLYAPEQSSFDIVDDGCAAAVSSGEPVAVEALGSIKARFRPDR